MIISFQGINVIIRIAILCSIISVIPFCAVDTEGKSIRSTSKILVYHSFAPIVSRGVLFTFLKIVNVIQHFVNCQIYDILSCASFSF